MAFKKQLTKEQALQKARHYCGYQERSHAEVKEKLYSFGLRRQEVDETLSQLIEDDYLNEERFACQFAGGHFRMKHWGRVKIRHELKQRQVGEYNIKKAIASIDEAEGVVTQAERLVVGPKLDERRVDRHPQDGEQQQWKNRCEHCHHLRHSDGDAVW